jgi:hypothetical protein
VQPPKDDSELFDELFGPRHSQTLGQHDGMTRICLDDMANVDAASSLDASADEARDEADVEHACGPVYVSDAIKDMFY